VRKHALSAGPSTTPQSGTRETAKSPLERKTGLCQDAENKSKSPSLPVIQKIRSLYMINIVYWTKSSWGMILRQHRSWLVFYNGT